MTINPFQLYDITLSLTRSELELLLLTVKRIIPEGRFHENLVMKINDKVEETLKSISSG